MDTIFQKLNQAGARYLLIGGQAMRLHGLPRYSMDWDLFIPSKDEANHALINEALKDDLELPVVLLGSKGENFLQTEQLALGILQFHLVVPGLQFASAEKESLFLQEKGGTLVRCVSALDLLKSKLAANRPVDQQDILFLRVKLGQD